MTTVTHAFVSPISDGADATLVRPSNWNELHTVDGFGANSFQGFHLKLAGTERMVITGTNDLVIGGFGLANSIILGQPKVNDISFTVLNNYLYDQLNRLALSRDTRATLQGSADLYLTDDFGTRSRVVLAGRS
jgi:hypothetical protein